MRKAITTTLAAAFAVTAIIITPLAIDDRPARLLLLALMGTVALAAFADAAFCHGRHCRRHGALYEEKARHAA